MIQLDHSLKRISETKIEFRYRFFIYKIWKFLKKSHDQGRNHEKIAHDKKIGTKCQFSWTKVKKRSKRRIDVKLVNKDQNYDPCYPIFQQLSSTI